MYQLVISKGQPNYCHFCFHKHAHLLLFILLQKYLLVLQHFAIPIVAPNKARPNNLCFTHSHSKTYFRAIRKYTKIMAISLEKKIPYRPLTFNFFPQKCPFLREPAIFRGGDPTHLIPRPPKHRRWVTLS